MGRLFDGDIPPSYVAWEDVYNLLETVVRDFANYPWLGWSSELWKEGVAEAHAIWKANEPEDFMYFM